MGGNYYPEIFGEQLLEWLRRNDVKPRNAEENIHDPAIICDLLRNSGFEVIKCADCLLDTNNPGTTWFVVAQKP